jgi:hypothetical protein
LVVPAPITPTWLPWLSSTIVVTFHESMSAARSTFTDREMRDGTPATAEDYTKA